MGFPPRREEVVSPQGRHGRIRWLSPGWLAVGTVLAALGVNPGCGRTVNDYLKEAESGSPQAIEDAVSSISRLLAYKETAQVPFDEGDRAAVAYLREVAVASPIPSNRASAIQGLGRLRTIDALELFVKALGDDFWLARYMAVRALEVHGDERHVPALVELLEGETQHEVRLAAVKALGAIGGEVATRALFEIYLVPRPRYSDEMIHAYLALRRMTGLSHGIEDRGDWAAAFKTRFPAPVEDDSP